MAYLKTVETNTEVVIDENSEVLSIDTKRKQILVDSPEQYFTVFAKLIGIQHDLSGSAVKLSQFLIGNAPINDNYMCITGPYREEIGKKIGVSSYYVKDLLKELCDKRVLIKDNRSPRSSCYYINPEYYWKGDMSGRHKAMKYLFELKYLP